MSISAVILAAGKGVRMKSDLPKVLHPLWGKPLVHYPVQLAKALHASPISVVTGYRPDGVRAALKSGGVSFVHQSPQGGTGHALMCVGKAWGRFKSPVLMLLGDVPLLKVETLRELMRVHRAQRPAATVLTAEVEKPRGYGRIVRDGLGRVSAIVEELDAREDQKNIPEINTGIFIFDPLFLNSHLSRLGRENQKKEYYVTDLVAIASEEGLPVEAVRVADPREIQGINTRKDLLTARDILRQFTVDDLIERGVTILDGRSVYVEPGVSVGEGTVLHPHVFLRGETRIGRNCEIEPGAVIQNSVLADGVRVKPYCVIEESVIGQGAQVGPFARLRPASRVAEDARVGNFVEMKKTTLGRGSKAQHLSYLGDATIGEGVNVGAGTITCNYDGKKKYRTILEKGVFVGSDTQFVAPVRVGKGAYIGAGSTITENVPPGALALSRAPQKNIKGWTSSRRRHRR
ncbi:MAG: bifunctional UDP-N-acetylglucosamine diphosphorylase/glucosamine-1-phosphate N-acetyltransferase GlmU [Nitrospirae bacterium]|nr:bifunctional UDP-N-acetylglucosamine diphosphorylase/glucosamine-1-phosphate N-acetyltransferase GlmU [Nitrospirota bacterium]